MNLNPHKTTNDALQKNREFINILIQKKKIIYVGKTKNFKEKSFLLFYKNPRIVKRQCW